MQEANNMVTRFAVPVPSTILVPYPYGMIQAYSWYIMLQSLYWHKVRRSFSLAQPWFHSKPGAMGWYNMKPYVVGPFCSMLARTTLVPY